MSEISGRDSLDKFISNLDGKSKLLVLYILGNRHAKIKELSRLVLAPSDSYTLMKIRGVINPVAKDILGREILTFEESKTDPVTGEKIPFSWWIADEIELIKRNELVDVFDEKNYLKIVTEVPHASEDNIKIDMESGFITISAGDYSRRIPLTCKVEEIADKTCKNGILEISLKKCG